MRSIRPAPPPLSDRIGAAHPVCCQSYWASWCDGLSEALPRLGMYSSSGQGNMVVSLFGIEECKERRKESEEDTIVKVEEDKIFGTLSNAVMVNFL